MTRTIQIVPTIDNEASGPSYSVTRLCAALCEAGHATRLVTLEPKPPNAGTFVETFARGVGPERLGRSPGMRRYLRTQTRTGKCDILHNNSLWMLPNLYPAEAVAGTSCKLVVAPRGTLSPVAMQRSRLLKKVLGPMLVAPVLSRAAAFHATSQAECDDIRARGLRQPIAVLPNGVDVPDRGMGVGKARRRVLFLGRIHPIKGIDNLLHAWSMVQDRFVDWELTVAGPDDVGHLAHLKALAQELGLQRSTFSGPLYGADKLEAYRTADIYVLPTHSENFGMTVAEALAAGTPVITTKGSPWSGLEREAAGWWIDIGAEPLAEALGTALSLPPDELAALGQRGRDWMARDFSWERIAFDMARFYYWLQHGGTQPEFLHVD